MAFSFATIVLVSISLTMVLRSVLSKDWLIIGLSVKVKMPSMQVVVQYPALQIVRYSNWASGHILSFECWLYREATKHSVNTWTSMISCMTLFKRGIILLLLNTLETSYATRSMVAIIKAWSFNNLSSTKADNVQTNCSKLPIRSFLMQL